MAERRARYSVMLAWDGTWLSQHQESALEPGLAIIDPHHHLWDLPGRMPYLLDHLRDDTRAGHDVIATVYVECGWGYRDEGPEHLRPVGEVERVAALAGDSVRDKPQILGIVGFADMTSGDAVDEVLDAALAAGRGRFRGVRHSTASDPDPDPKVPRAGSRPRAGMMLEPQFHDGVARVGRKGLTFDAWLFHPQLPELVTLAHAAPHTTIVLDHLGSPLGVGSYAHRRDEVMDQWRRDLAAVARCENVVLKVGGIGMTTHGSGFETRARPPSSEALAILWEEPICFAIEQFGAQRCMFESNFPVDKASCSYVVLWNTFKRICSQASPTEKALLFSETAARVYRL